VYVYDLHTGVSSSTDRLRIDSSVSEVTWRYVPFLTDFCPSLLPLLTACTLIKHQHPPVGRRLPPRHSDIENLMWQAIVKQSLNIELASVAHHA